MPMLDREGNLYVLCMYILAKDDGLINRYVLGGVLKVSTRAASARKRTDREWP